MATIVEQIQHDALDHQIPVSSLLRRVKLAAIKLGLGKVESWVEQELNGYTTEVPKYRMVRGQPMAHNPHLGWQRIGGDVEDLSRVALGQSIASLEDIFLRYNNSMHIRYNANITSVLDEQNEVENGHYALHIDRSQIAAILDAVRNLVLDWAIELERAGVMGSEFSFNPEEKRKAQEVPTISIGMIGSFAGNLGTGNTSGDITASNINIDQVKRLVEQTRQHAKELIESGADHDALERNLNAIEEETAKAAPDQSILRGLLTDLRNTASGAAGNIIASGILTTINHIFGTGVPSP